MKINGTEAYKLIPAIASTVALVLSIGGVFYTAGALSQRMTALEARTDKIERVVEMVVEIKSDVRNIRATVDVLVARDEELIRRSRHYDSEREKQ